MAQIEHRLPGRIRLRLRARQGDAVFFAQAVQALADAPGVRAIKANAMTGSLLIEHHGDEDAVFAAALAKALFDVEPRPRPPLFGTTPSHVGANLSPLHLAAGGLAGAGLLQLLRGRALGSASENLWNAWTIYAQHRGLSAALVLVALGLAQITRGQVLGSAVSLFAYSYHARRMALRRNPGTTA
ncbi:MAG TPA: hypothetical protein VE650_11110 [Acetobacteraceae bacterium]|nr:hypothetical protein [Acetobacteraceae bacterium]